MPRDINDIYTLPAGNPVIPGTVIETSWANNTLSDIAQALTDSLDKSDPTEARDTLGLGTAATADVQLSRTDATIGALMGVGAFNFGETSSLSTITQAQLDDWTYGTNGQTMRIVSPTGLPAGTYLVRFNRSAGGNNVYQELIGMNIAARYERMMSSSTGITAWEKVWTSHGTNVVTVDTGSIGFGAGAGGSVTQATSKATSVTLNKPTGRIITHNAALAAGASVVFQLNSTAIAVTDCVLANISGNSNYSAQCINVANGIGVIRLTNISGGSLSDAVTINFIVIKGAIT